MSARRLLFSTLITQSAPAIVDCLWQMMRMEDLGAPLTSAQDASQESIVIDQPIGCRPE
jgi:hypothetical protein